MKIFDKNNLKHAQQWLTDGNLLAYPTEAVWGIGCDPFNEQAVLKLLEIKNRPLEKGLIVLTANHLLINDFLQNLPFDKQQQILQSWQNFSNTTKQKQATTWLFSIPSNLSTNIPYFVTGGRTSLAIRIIEQQAIADLCQSLVSPHNPYGFLVSTSCNPSGKPPATTLEQAQSYFGDTIGYFNAPTLGFTEPSQIKDALTGEIVRD
ncbi:L-threonylcarbamoyladenylate synthase [Faucicola mancuniensis]|uniref:L-threonylcarbamoyladenylate synthase n=1 Tax=Faucicola mancuniensis TaxID=1309795 RepID=UPI0028E7F156|nr:Sua5/YciO/YrdC/YwlC family protein [uncultured Moraxella sp.]